MIDITAILISLCPESNWATDGDKIIWEDEINKQPTDEEIEIERKRLTALLPIKKLRKERDYLLKKSDVYGLRDYPSGDKRDAWDTYRQQLRDLPANYIPFDSSGNVIDVIYPTPPFINKDKY